ncbi:cytochrome c oxidase accessory protein CcoG [bacterium]|nr:cytochrome c oxidase accessory protein CcoG [bacterium]
MSSEKKKRLRRPDLETVYTINEDGSRNFLHPADVHGRWQVRKDILFAFLVVVYVGLPWLQVGGHPAVHVDIPGRLAYLFGLSFSNQDFYLLFFPLVGIGFGLFVLTALWGRIWCGYACPQTVFMEGIFRKLERLIEGPRDKRIKRNLGPWTGGKLGRKAFKWIFFVGISAGIAHAFLSYFIPARELYSIIWQGPAGHGVAFGWTIFWTVLMSFNFLWFREQTCLVICPYGRLQSALIDDDTVVIGYDENRGEPREKGVDKGGDCIDCFRCVAVCPTGIDIRAGLQMECVGCANCIDACDDMMERIGKPKGLVRYDSFKGLSGLKRRFFRPRVYGYMAFALIWFVGAFLAIGQRSNFEAKSVRSSGLPFQLVGDDLRNLYTLHIQNKTDEPRVYLVSFGGAEGPEPEMLISQTRLYLAPFEVANVPIFATLLRADYPGTFPMEIAVTDSLSGEVKPVTFNFRGP